MKIFFVILAVFVLPFLILAQKKKISEKDSPDANFDCFPVQFSKVLSSEKKPLPYKKIILMDKRPDTSKGGYWYSKRRRQLMKLCFNEGFEKNVSSFFNTYLKDNLDSIGNSVLACIKKCWTKIDEDPDFYKTSLKIEFYLKTDSAYYPLYRYDESLIKNSKEFSEPNQFIEQAIAASLNKLYNSTIISPGMKGLSYQQIDSFNNQFERLSVLKDKTAAKGVYLNFNQFKNNQPAYKNFELDLGGQADAIFVEGKNVKDSVITDAWGFSDGENTFVRIAMNYFPLFRCGNTFDLYGFDKITKKQIFPVTPYSSNGRDPYYSQGVAGALSTGLSGLLGMIKSKSKNLKPYQIDMDTGELY